MRIAISGLESRLSICRIGFLPSGPGFPTDPSAINHSRQAGINAFLTAPDGELDVLMAATSVVGSWRVERFDTLEPWKWRLDRRAAGTVALLVYEGRVTSRPW